MVRVRFSSPAPLGNTGKGASHHHHPNRAGMPIWSPMLTGTCRWSGARSDRWSPTITCPLFSARAVALVLWRPLAPGRLPTRGRAPLDAWRCGLAAHSCARPGVGGPLVACRHCCRALAGSRGPLGLAYGGRVMALTVLCVQVAHVTD